MPNLLTALRLPPSAECEIRRHAEIIFGVYGTCDCLQCNNGRLRAIRDILPALAPQAERIMREITRDTASPMPESYSYEDIARPSRWAGTVLDEVFDESSPIVGIDQNGNIISTPQPSTNETMPATPAVLEAAQPSAPEITPVAESDRNPATIAVAIHQVRSLAERIADKQQKRDNPDYRVRIELDWDCYPDKVRFDWVQYNRTGVQEQYQRNIYGYVNRNTGAAFKISRITGRADRESFANIFEPDFQTKVRANGFA